MTIIRRLFFVECDIVSSTKNPHVTLGNKKKNTKIDRFLTQRTTMNQINRKNVRRPMVTHAKPRVQAATNDPAMEFCLMQQAKEIN
jgi:hypothetical protein